MAGFWGEQGALLRQIGAGLPLNGSQSGMNGQKMGSTSVL